jgi:hypothetical protein
MQYQNDTAEELGSIKMIQHTDLNDDAVSKRYCMLYQNDTELDNILDYPNNNNTNSNSNYPTNDFKEESNNNLIHDYIDQEDHLEENIYTSNNLISNNNIINNNRLDKSGILHFGYLSERLRSGKQFFSALNTTLSIEKLSIRADSSESAEQLFAGNTSKASTKTTISWSSKSFTVL